MEVEVLAMFMTFVNKVYSQKGNDKELFIM